MATTGVLFQRLTDRLDAGIPLGRATFRTVGHSYPRNRDRAAMGAAVLAAQGGAGGAPRLARPGEPPAAATDAPIRRDPTNRQMLAFLARQARAHRRLPRCAGSSSGTVGPSGSRGRAGARRWVGRVEWLPERRAGYLADPFPACRDGVTAMLVEEFDERSATGVISAVRRDGDGWTTTSGVLDPGVHASYPFLFEHDGDAVLRPGDGPGRARRGVAVRRVPGPVGAPRHRCSTTSPLLDPTIVEWDGRWWLFGTRRDRDPNAELWLWHAPSPFGPWTAHPANPVKIDVRSSRPAGTPFVRDGVLYRPAQDCSRGYGGAVVINRVVRLDETAFVEEPVERVVVGGRRTRPARTPSPSATGSSPSTPAGGSSTSTAAGASCSPGCAGHGPDRARPLRHRQPHRRRRRDVARPHGAGLPRPRPRAACRLPQVALGRRRRPAGRRRHAPPGRARRQPRPPARRPRAPHPPRSSPTSCTRRSGRPTCSAGRPRRYAASRRDDVRQQQLLTGPARQPGGEPVQAARRPGRRRGDRPSGGPLPGGVRAGGVGHGPPPACFPPTASSSFPAPAGATCSASPRPSDG